MATLDEVLGALLTSVTRARLSSDLLTLSLQGSYSDEPVLRRLPAPRAVVHEVDLTLRFVVNDLVGDVSDDEKEAAMTDAWLREVRRLTPVLLLPSETNAESLGPTLAQVYDGVAKTAPQLNIADALAHPSRRAYTIGETTRLLLELRATAIRKLPSLATTMRPEAEVRAASPTSLSQLFLAKASEIRAAAVAKTSLAYRAEVSIAGDELARAEPSQTHELRLKIRSDDLYATHEAVALAANESAGGSES